MDRKTLCAKLKELRESRFPDRAQFLKVSKLDQTAVAHVENYAETGGRFMSVDRIKRWVNACGVSLPEFFAEFEPDTSARVDVRVDRGNRATHQKLEEILAGGGEPALYISGNIAIFHRDYVVRKRGKR